MKHVLGPQSRTTLTEVREGDSQPNAVDLRLGQVFKISDNLFEISNEHKKHRGTEYQLKTDPEGYYNLEMGRYEVTMENIVNVGHGEAGWVITRSTLNRNGLYLTSGLYDSGYHGVMAAVLHVTTGRARIKQGTRIGQYLSFDAESLSTYDGDYGINKDHDKKYGAK